MSALVDAQEERGAAPPEAPTMTLPTAYYKALEAVALHAGMLRMAAWPSERVEGSETITDYRISAFELEQLDAALKAWYAEQARMDSARKKSAPTRSLFVA